MAVLALRCPHCKIRFSIKDTQVDDNGMAACASCAQNFVVAEHQIETQQKEDDFLIHDDMDEDLIHDDMDESYLENLDDDDFLIHDDMDTQPLQRGEEIKREEIKKEEIKPEPALVAKKPLKTRVNVPKAAKKAIPTKTNTAPKSTTKVVSPKTLQAASLREEILKEEKQKKKEQESQATKSDLLDRYYSEGSKFGPDQDKTWLWSGSIGLLVLLIIFQTLYFNFHTWSRTSVRPVYEGICMVIRCTVPPIQDVDLMATQHIVVRTHPKFKQALMIDTLIINNAEFEQPFPDLLLVFRDNKDWVVASRRFKPNKYLSGELAGETMMPAQIPIHISLEILDPGPQAVNYGVSLMANQ